MKPQKWLAIISILSIPLAAFAMLGLTGCTDPDNDTSTLIVPDEYPTIQAAINASDHGDEITVMPGSYAGRIDFTGKNITLRSDDPEDPEIVAATIIDGAGAGTVVTFGGGETNAAVLRGFTITGGNAGNANGGGILVGNGSAPVITGNVITRNEATYGAGVTVTGGAAPVIESNVFIDNTATSRRGSAIYAIGQSSVVLQDNVFRDHVGGDGVIHIGGANANDASAAVIAGNTLDNNSTDFGVGAIKVTVQSRATITGNVITNNTGATDNAAGAIYVGFNSEADIRDNTITGNRGTRAGAIVVYRESSAVITGNTITGNAAGTEDDTRYGTGGGILVTYQADAEITGNTISNNRAWNQNHGGGGIAVYSWGQASNVTIADNTITDNQAYRWGGGIYLASGSGTSAVIHGNSIADNVAGNASQACGGGIYIGNIKEAAVYDNTVSGNQAAWFGGGIFIYRDVPVLGPGGVPWGRNNDPPGSETHNTYAGNTHGDDRHQGAHVFFDENR
jgi:hypothetical protein